MKSIILIKRLFITIMTFGAIVFTQNNLLSMLERRNAFMFVTPGMRLRQTTPIEKDLQSIIRQKTAASRDTRLEESILSVIRRRGDINGKHPIYDHTPLDIAVQAKSGDLIALLIEHGADCANHIEKILQIMTAEQLRTSKKLEATRLLKVALDKRNMHQAYTQLENGALRKIITGVKGQDYFTSAIKQKDAVLLKLLMTEGDPEEIKTLIFKPIDEQGATIAHLVAQSACEQMVTVLRQFCKKYKVSLHDVRDHNDQGVLHYVWMNTEQTQISLLITLLLLEVGADAFMSNDYGQTPCDFIWQHINTLDDGASKDKLIDFLRRLMLSRTTAQVIERQDSASTVRSKRSPLTNRSPSVCFGPLNESFSCAPTSAGGSPNQAPTTASSSDFGSSDVTSMMALFDSNCRLQRTTNQQ